MQNLYDSDAMRRFTGLELGDHAIPDGPEGPSRQWRVESPQDAILNFHHLLERHDLTQAIFETMDAYLCERGILLREGRWWTRRSSTRRARRRTGRARDPR